METEKPLIDVPLLLVEPTQYVPFSGGSRCLVVGDTINVHFDDDGFVLTYTAAYAMHVHGCFRDAAGRYQLYTEKMKET